MAQPPILTLTDVTLGFGGNPLFSALSLAIPQEARLALVGRNGSGKSTLLKLMAGRVEPDAGTRFVKPKQHVAYLDQDPDLSGFQTLRDFAISDLDANAHHSVDRIAQEIKVDLTRTPNAASGGERRRAALVKILAEDPDLMLLDEPTNHLDIEAIEWLENRLLSGRSNFVLISHDRAFLRRLTRGILWLDRGVMRVSPHGFERFEDWRDKTFEEEDQARHKMDRLIKAEARWAVEGISARRKRNQGRLRNLHALKEERASQIKRRGAADLQLGEAEKSGKIVLEAFDIAKSFHETDIIKPLSLRIARGDRIALMGPNGVGKTTLLKLLMKEMEPDTGRVKHGTNLAPIYFDQKREALDGARSLWSFLTDDKKLGVSGKNDQIMVRGSPRHVAGYLKDFLFEESQIRGPISVLSGGEKARLLLAKLFAQEGNFLILDEPTNDLDIETLDLLQELLDEYTGTVLIVSHDRDFVDRIATKTLIFEGKGAITTHAGGWSDVNRSSKKDMSQDAKPKAKAKKTETQDAKKVKSGGMSFSQKHRLDELPAEMERLEMEISKLEAFLSDPELFTKEPVKFQKASEGLVERQKRLADAEEEWLELETIREGEG